MVTAMLAERYEWLSRTLSTVLTAASVSMLLSNSATATVESVKDLRYGVTLYHFFQQNYFDALTELGAAQQLQMLPNHGDEAELLRGGMSLSYGMDMEARRVFETLLTQTTQGVDSDRAWFYVGKLAWRRGDIAASASALARVAPDYTGPVADEAHYLLAMQWLAAGEEQAARQHLQLIRESCPFKPYYFYNLGAARASIGDWANAVQAFHQVERLACGDEEGKALRDKAYTAAGFASLAMADPGQATEDFLAVRLQGPESDRALLGYGWSKANLGDYAGALVPWGELNTRSMVTTSARESLLAVPFAYEQLQRPATALQLYQQAAQRYAAERSGLDVAINRLREGDLLQLFGLDAEIDPQWLGGEDPLPEGEHGIYLTHLLTTDGVQLALRELYDLREIKRRLLQAEQRLAVLHQVDREQRANWSETAEGGRAELLVRQRDALLQRTVQLRGKLDSAIAEEDSRALAGRQQLARWQRLEQAEQLALRLQNDSALKQLRLMRGMMQWQDDENYPANRWRLQREMRQLETLADESAAAYAALGSAMAGSARPVFEQRIASMEKRREEQQGIVETALTAAVSQLRSVALAELESQRGRLAASEGQALLAVARLYDQASPEVPR